MRPLRHGYTNHTVGDGSIVVKAYEGPDGVRRREREHLLLTLLEGVLPVPQVRGQDDGTLVVAHVAGVPGQDLLHAGHAEPVLAECGRLLRRIHQVQGPPVDALGTATDGQVLVHGDYGPNNLLFDPVTFAVTAVVDWEFSRLGQPIEDLAWCEWIVRMHHPEAVGALDSFFDAYGEKPLWTARQAVMVDACRALEEFCERWEPGGPGVAQWQHRAGVTASWQE